MFISKLVCDKCGTEVGALDKYCRECGTAGTTRFKDDNALDKLAKESLICKGCGKLLSQYTNHMCLGPFTMDKAISIRYDSNDNTALLRRTNGITAQ